MTSKPLPLMEHFLTLQGEGFYAGTAAYFLRLGGCDVGCVWCDVKESWDAAKHPMTEVSEMTKVARSSGAKIAVVTGGEPLLHSLDELTASIKNAGIKAHLETSGSSPLSGSWDWITLSPKKFKAPLEESLKAANELKVVVYNESDFAWAEKHAAMVGPECLLFLQPEWDRRDKILPMLIEYIMHHPQWRLSLQTHKYLNIP